MYFKATIYITSVTSNNISFYIMHFRFGQLSCFPVILHYWCFLLAIIHC